MEGTREKSNYIRQNIIAPAGTLGGSKKAMRMTIHFNPNATFSDIGLANKKSATPTNQALDTNACCQWGDREAPVEFGDHTDFRGKRMCRPCATQEFRKMAAQSHCDARDFVREVQWLWPGAKVVNHRIH
jgi:hypothetical protein